MNFENLHRIESQLSKRLKSIYPHYVLIGDQNTAKSTLINHLIGAIVLPCRKGNNHLNFNARTICPLSLHVRREQYKDPDEIHVMYMIYDSNSQVREQGDCITTDRSKLVHYILDFFEKHQNKNNILNNDNCLVELDIRGNFNEEIHYIDLPGLRNDNTDLTDKITKTISNYIKKHPHIIPIFVMNSACDITASNSCKFITEFIKYNGNNDVIIVMTKPDTLNERNKSLIDLLEGNGPLQIPKSNIFIVKMYDTCEESDININKSLNDESAWFLNRIIYKNLPDNLKSQLGIINLKNFINIKLFEKIKNELPKLVEKLKQEISDAQRKLSNMTVFDQKQKLLYYGEHKTKIINEIEKICNKLNQSQGKYPNIYKTNLNINYKFKTSLFNYNYAFESLNNKLNDICSDMNKSIDTCCNQILGQSFDTNYINQFSNTIKSIFDISEFKNEFSKYILVQQEAYKVLYLDADEINENISRNFNPYMYKYYIINNLSKLSNELDKKSDSMILIMNESTEKTLNRKNLVEKIQENQKYLNIIND